MVLRGGGRGPTKLGAVPLSALGEGNDLKYRIVDRHAIHSWRRSFDQSTDPIDDVARSLAVSSNAPECLPHFFQIRRPRTQPAQSRIGVDDRRNDWFTSWAKLTAPTRRPSVPKPNGRLVVSLAITRKELVYGSGLQC